MKRNETERNGKKRKETEAKKRTHFIFSTFRYAFLAAQPRIWRVGALQACTIGHSKSVVIGDEQFKGEVQNRHPRYTKTTWNNPYHI